jgi:type IV pilus assembly protein PilE
LPLIYTSFIKYFFYVEKNSKISERNFLHGGGDMRKGFTLIELLVVVLIIGILAAIALPKYNDAVLEAKFVSLMPELRAFANAVRIYRLTTGSDPASVNDLDITPSAQMSPSVDGGKFQIGGALGDYTGKTMVWLSLRPGHNYEIVCETFAAYAPGVKLCRRHGGVKRACTAGIYQGTGAIDCYTIPMPGAN